MEISWILAEEGFILIFFLTYVSCMFVCLREVGLYHDSHEVGVRVVVAGGLEGGEGVKRLEGGAGFHF